jgi:hypothetical protein
MSPFLIALSLPSLAIAQSQTAPHHHHPATERATQPAADQEHMGHDQIGMSHDHAQMHHEMPMAGMLGDYSMSQEASGTSWQPASTPMHGVHFMADDWMFMAHGMADLVYDNAGGDRGGEKTFSTNMFMLMATRPLGAGKLGVRGMFSLEPATIGKFGYPELLQTGETADGETPLIDRQHPHDLFMELAASYSIPLNQHDSAFIYAGLPGEPALGPATFMHRFSGMDNPEAPITHHWLDSTHISEGVITLGYIWNNALKVDGSIFTGREPDEHRWDIEQPKLDSQSIRLTINPTADLAGQISFGHLNSPEQLESGVDQNRTTASITYNKPLGPNDWQTTLAWGRDDNDPGRELDGFLLESAIVLHHTHTIFGRFERVKKDELFTAPDPLAGEAFWVNKLSLGYIYDFPETHQLQFGLGALGSIHFIPGELEDVYGSNPTSFMIFARVRL